MIAVTATGTGVRVMSRVPAQLAIATLVAAVCLPGATTKAAAQTHPIDCAILLCLSGGWPASVPCARARAEFIRRITPWPIEPPLQIWRCPMGASYRQESYGENASRLYDILFAGAAPLPHNFEHEPPSDDVIPMPAVLGGTTGRQLSRLQGRALQFVQDRADIDISGPAFNFVRSIHVFDVRYARQHEAGEDSDCHRMATVRRGSYGIQGEFSWHVSSPGELPAAHRGLERWGEDCPSIFHRSVFVDWQDYFGTYGFEQVNY